jgi:hypothetical protein
MMRGALLVLGLLGTVVLIGAGALGYGLGGAAEEQVRSHVLLSLAATLVLIFSHTWIVLYLLATGRVISQAAAERYPGGAGGDAAVAVLLERARRLRLRALPWLLAAIGALAAAFLTGSAAASGSIPAPVHQALFYVTLAAQGAAMLIERRVLAEHDRVGDDLRRRLQADAA